MKERLELLYRTLQQGNPAITAMVTACRGATPRSPGALLVRSAKATAGTVGGGQAEHDIITGPAASMLNHGPTVQVGWHQCLSAEELRHMGQEYGGEEEILLLVGAKGSAAGRSAAFGHRAKCRLLPAD